MLVPGPASSGPCEGQSSEALLHCQVCRDLRLTVLASHAEVLPMPHLKVSRLSQGGAQLTPVALQGPPQHPWHLQGTEILWWVPSGGEGPGKEESASHDSNSVATVSAAARLVQD